MEQKAIKELILSFVRCESFAKDHAAIFAFQKQLELQFQPLFDESIWIQLLEEPPYALLFMRKRMHAKKRVLFVLHADVAKGAKGCQLREEGGRLYGPGVADMKGGIALLFAALQEFDSLYPDSALGYDLAIVPDEESGSPYSQKALVKVAHGASFCLVMEPAFEDGSLVSTRSGSLSLKICFEGVLRHAGRSKERLGHALYAAARLTLWIEKQMAPDLSTNVGYLTGGKELNTTADYAELHANFRPDTDEVKERLILELKEEIERLSKESGCQITYETLSERPPKLASKELEERIKRIAKELHIPITFRHARGVTDGNSLSQLGIPSIDTLGPVGCNLHSKEEHILLSSLAERYQLLLNLLTSFHKDLP